MAAMLSEAPRFLCRRNPTRTSKAFDGRVALGAGVVRNAPRCFLNDLIDARTVFPGHADGRPRQHDAYVGAVQLAAPDVEASSARCYALAHAHQPMRMGARQVGGHDTDAVVGD